MIQDTLKSIQEGWVGSTLVLNDVNASSEQIASSQSISIVIIILLTLFLVFFRRECISILHSFVSLFKYREIFDIEENQYLSSSRNVTTIISIPTVALVFIKQGIVGLNYWYFLGILAAFIIVRMGLFRIFNWATGGKGNFLLVEKCCYNYFIVFMCFSLLSPVILYLFPEINPVIIDYYLIIIFSIITIIYFLRGYQIIISSGLSHFLWFLYLCTLELLPFCFFINTVAHL
ncbi:MAG: DUF4271 domain-containing protein [Bacteroidales bacterium]|jgi:hypothetical protein